MTDQTLTLTLDCGEGPNGEKLGGDVVIKLRPDLAPGHVARITELAQEGFYDGILFHRVIPGFMAQGGCPHGTGMGGRSEEHTSEPQSLMRNSYAVFCLNNNISHQRNYQHTRILRSPHTHPITIQHLYTPT